MPRFLAMVLMVVVVAAMASGCAVNRSVLKVAAPEATPSAAGKPALIRTIVDKRVFVDRGTDPNMPSLGEGGWEKHTPEQRSRAVGRKRNSWGKAIGDVFLEEGNSVQQMIRASLGAALQRLGYGLVPTESTPPDGTLVLDVVINKYWSWIDMGFATIGIEAEIATDVSVGPPHQQTKTITAKAEKRVLAATESQWQEVLDKVVREYVANAEATLRQAGL